jgi:hypothetical protein
MEEYLVKAGWYRTLATAEERLNAAALSLRVDPRHGFVALLGNVAKADHVVRSDLSEPVATELQLMELGDPGNPALGKDRAASWLVASVFPIPLPELPLADVWRIHIIENKSSPERLANSDRLPQVSVVVVAARGAYHVVALYVDNPWLAVSVEPPRSQVMAFMHDRAQRNALLRQLTEWLEQ